MEKEEISSEHKVRMGKKEGIVRGRWRRADYVHKHLLGEKEIRIQESGKRGGI